MNTTKFIAIFATLCSVCLAGEPERVILLSNPINLDPVVKLLNEGWTVKHQSAAVSISGTANMQMSAMVVFTLTPPPPDVLAENEAKRMAAIKEAFEKKRAEYLAKQPQVEKAKSGGWRN